MATKSIKMYDKIDYKKPEKHPESKLTDWQARLDAQVFSEAKEKSFCESVKITKLEAIDFYPSH